MWFPVVPQETANSAAAVPSTRSKHAVAFHPKTNAVYLFGGRSSSSPLRDFWNLSLDTGAWKCAALVGDCPFNLQEHSMVTVGDHLLLFGGSFSHSTDCPLWLFNVQSNKWDKWKHPPGGKPSSYPQGRRAHSAVVDKDLMYVYGGYEDMKGSSGELWTFSCDSMTWTLIHGNASNNTNPPGRHKHSAVVYDDCMWVYGGMTDLQERGDLWRFDLVSKQWSNIRCKSSPGPLHSHSAVRVHSHMLIFGGERSGVLSDELWRFHFATEVWERIETGSGQKPSGRAQLCGIALPVPAFLRKCQEIKTESVSSLPTPADENLEKNPQKNRMFNGRTGYEPVPRAEVDQIPEADTGRTKLWPLVRSFTYSALSNNTSTESLATTELEESSKNQIIHTSNQTETGSDQKHPVNNKPNFIRRSITTVRVNPFIPGGSKTDSFELGTLSTSDYCSEYNGSLVSVSGIPNPLYNNYFLPVMEQSEDQHKDFASALNASISQTQVRRHPLNLLSDLLPFPAAHTSAELPEEKNLLDKNFCVLFLGGRDGGHVTAFRRPISVWMLQI